MGADRTMTLQEKREHVNMLVAGADEAHIPAWQRAQLDREIERLEREIADEEDQMAAEDELDRLREHGPEDSDG